jgi:hypothetical protein
MTARRWVGLLALPLVVAMAGCADWVGEDVESGDAAAIQRPDDVSAPPTTASTVPPDPVDPRGLAVGDCADDAAAADGTLPATIDVVAQGGPVVPRVCIEPHRYEVYAVTELAAPEAPWPGPDQLGEDALDLCTRRLEDYVGVAWVDSELDLLFLVPDEATWATGDRVVRCILFDLGLEPLDGSAAGTGW